jgi:hypothetical protein
MGPIFTLWLMTSKNIRRDGDDNESGRQPLIKAEQ